MDPQTLLYGILTLLLHPANFLKDCIITGVMLYMLSAFSLLFHEIPPPPSRANKLYRKP